MIKLVNILTESTENKVINESRSTPVIVVDIQPGYDMYCGHLIEELCEFLNTQHGKILILFNGEDLALDSLEDVQNYYLENGLDEDKISQIHWKEKMYGYFRDIIDSGFPDSTVIKVIRGMVYNRVNDSRDLPTEFTEALIESDNLDLETYPAFLPDIAISLLREYKNGYICGGARDECYKEIKLFMNALNINCKEMQKFIY